MCRQTLIYIQDIEAKQENMLKPTKKKRFIVAIPYGHKLESTWFLINRRKDEKCPVPEIECNSAKVDPPNSNVCNH